MNLNAFGSEIGSLNDVFDVPLSLDILKHIKACINTWRLLAETPETVGPSSQMKYCIVHNTVDTD